MYTVYMIVYNIIMYIIQPVIWMRLLWCSRKFPSYRHRWLERYGLYQCASIPSNGIVIHAVSLGETILVMPLIRALRKCYPDIVIILTSMTPTGIELAQCQCAEYNNVYCRYLPYDLFGAMMRFVKYIQPRLVMTIETELWPNFINILYKRSIPFIVVNARMSLNACIRYKRIKGFIKLLMNQIHLIAARSKEDASRFLELGCSQEKLFVMGNLKFDINLTQDLLKKISAFKTSWIKTRQVWIASSTHVGEEFLLLQAHKILLKIFPNLLMILVPRHPERCTDIKKIVENIGLSYIVKSSGLVPTADIQVVIGDTIGELMLLYGISNIAFIGGSLVKCGGHNPLEAAVHAIPVLMGPYTYNFIDICTKLHSTGGLITVTDILSLVKIISMLLKDKQMCLDRGIHASTVLKNNQGALQKFLYILKKIV